MISLKYEIDFQRNFITELRYVLKFLYDLTKSQSQIPNFLTFCNQCISLKKQQQQINNQDLFCKKFG